MKEINTTKAPKVVGPYSQAVVSDNFIFCSGQIGIDPKTGELATGGTGAETVQALTNLAAVLAEAGVTLADVVMVNVYLANMDDYVAMNNVYEEHFSVSPRPARAAVGVARLPKNARVEISCVARRK